jgi:hypothetical protein
MDTKIIVKYENNKPVYEDVKAPPSRYGSSSINGCVSGTPCLKCRWKKSDSRCASGIYCRKPTYMACP